jgi:penicillin amidase
MGRPFFSSGRRGFPYPAAESIEADGGLWMKLSMIFGLVAATLIGQLYGCGNSPQPGAPVHAEPAGQVTVYRDQYATPHVFAASNRGVFYGYGYVVASDRLFQMEMLRRTTQGRVAEVLGEEFLPLDVRLRTHYDHRSILPQLDALPASQREVLQAYAEGFNARVAEVLADTSLMPAEFVDHGFLPVKWTDYDVAMLFVGSIAHRYSDFNSERDNLALLQALEARHGRAIAWRIFNASKWLLDDDSPTTVPRSSQWRAPAVPSRPDYLGRLPLGAGQPRVALSAAGRFLGFSSEAGQEAGYRRQLAVSGFTRSPGFTGASNYWAVRGLDDARAVLVNGPQFGFSVPGYVYGIGLHGGDFHAVGNTLLALPALLFAHNNHIAWGSTAGISDQSDEFALILNPADPDRYRYRGAWRQLESWSEQISVRGGEVVTVTARRAAQGMVLDHQPGAGVAWVRARAWEGRELASLMAWVWLATDRSLDAAQRRIGSLATNINMYTMDRHGNLGYVHAGRYPRRSPGHDPRLPADGSGAFDWQGLRPYADNPTVRNPSQGFIANWNNRPRQDWISSDLWTYTWGGADRAGILVDMLTNLPERNAGAVTAVNQRLSFADVSAPTLLPWLFQAIAESGALDPETRAAIDLLANWDRQWRANQAGFYGPAPALMEAWSRTLLREVISDDIGPDFFHLYAATNHPNQPLGPSIPNPPGLKVLVRNLHRIQSGHWSNVDYDFFNGEAPAAALVRSLELAVAELRDSQGPDSDQWRLQAHPMQWQPYNFRGVPQARESAALALPAYMNRGSENNVFVATGEGIEARDVIPPGQSGFLGASGPAAHAADQMSLYSAFSDKPVPFTRAQVQAIAISRKVLPLPP